MAILPILPTLKTLILFLIIDVTYLLFLRGDFIRSYFSRFGGFHKNSAIIGLAAWTLLAFGIQKLAVDGAKSKRDALIKGAMLGLVIYGVYDLTNLVTIKGWTWNFTLQDMLWGTVLCGTIAYLRA